MAANETATETVAENGHGGTPRGGSAASPTDSLSVLLIPAPDQWETPQRLTMGNVQPGTTIGEVRQRAREMIASHPSIDRIRLIHSGRLLLREEQTLEQLVGSDTLRSNKNVPIHLILRPLPGRVNGPGQQGQPGIAAPGGIDPLTAAQLGPQPQHALLQGARPPFANQPVAAAFPPRPASTPAIPNANAPTSFPNQRSQPVATPLTGHTAASPTQAQLIAQLQQQHIHMMQAILNQPHMAPVQPPVQPPQGQGQVPLPEFQRMFNHLNHDIQARRAQLNGGNTQGSGIHAQSHLRQQPSNSFAVPSQTSLPQNFQHQPPQIGPRMNFGGPPGPHDLVHTSIQHGPAGRMMTTRVQLGGHMMPNQRSGPTFQQGAGTSIALRGVEHETVYLLSSPSGYEALLLAPPLTSRSTSEQNQMHQAQTHPPQVPQNQPGGQEHVLQNAADQQRGLNHQEENIRPLNLRDLLALLLPLGGQLWLLVRLAGITALLTFNASWSRTLLVWSVAIIIFLAQTGVFAPFQTYAERLWQPIRHHVEELVRDVEDEQLIAAADQPDLRNAAERLLRQQRDQSLLRRTERSVALFVASFVPGVGEAQVAAREAAERRRVRESQEREVAEARARHEAEDHTRQQQAILTENLAEPGRISPQPERPTSSTRPVDENRDGLRHRQPRVEDDDGEEAS